MKVCVVGVSGVLGNYMVRHALDRGYEVAGELRQASELLYRNILFRVN